MTKRTYRWAAITATVISWVGAGVIATTLIPTTPQPTPTPTPITSTK